jgi:hypothetical protein
MLADGATDHIHVQIVVELLYGKVTFLNGFSPMD